MIDDQQTHTLPVDSDDLSALGRFLGHDDEQDFRQTLVGHLELVERHYAQLFEESGNGSAEGSKNEGNLIFVGTDEDPETFDTLRGMGFKNPETIAALVRSWHHGKYRAMQNIRAQQILTELVPALLAAFGVTSDPDRAFSRFDDFLAGLPSGIQLFSMFLANPDLLDLVAEVMGSAPKLAEHMGHHPSVLESFLAPGFFDPPPDLESLADDFDNALAPARDFEDILDIARRWANDQRLRIGIQALRNLVDWETIGECLSDIAAAVIDRLKREVETEFQQKHGCVPGATSAIVAMGKLGGREMTPTSDLDLIFIYDHDEDAAGSDGERPLPPSQYFARLSQRLINAITALTAEGKLYDVDMRLRPSGNAGPIASHISAFNEYHQEKAWTWEHMALSRARVISGDGDLSERIETIIEHTLTAERDTDRLLADVIEMRERMDTEHHTGFIWEVKHLRGGIVDIEFVSQYLQLAHSHQCADVLSTNTLNALTKLHGQGFLNGDDFDVLTGGLEMWQAIQGMLRLTISGIFRPGREDEIPDPLKRSLARAAGCKDFDRLSSEIVLQAEAVFSVYQRLLAPPNE